MLKIDNVFKSYKKLKVLKGVSFSVKENEIKGIIGVNGAGKSTLIEIICGVKKADSGNIYINGLCTAQKRMNKKFKALIGYMPQSFSLFNDLTVKENLGYLCSVYKLNYKKTIPEMLKICSLQDKQNTLAGNLSGGYRQLLSVAGALIHKPKLLILDEPTSAMDPIFRKKFWRIIRRCMLNNITVLVITHYAEELNECDSFVCLKDGKVAIDKSVAEYQNGTLIDIEQLIKTEEGK